MLSTQSYGKKIPNNQKVTFQVSNYNQFIYDSEKPGVLCVSEFIDGLSSHEFYLSKPWGLRPALPSLNNYKAYNTKISINIKKMNNLKSLAQYIPEEDQYFYDTIFEWPTTNIDEGAEEDF